MGWAGRRVFSPGFWNVFFCVEKGVSEEKTETTIVNEHTVGRGGGRPGGTTEKEKKRGPKGRNSAENATCT